MYGPLLRRLISALAVEIPRTNVKLEERDMNGEAYRRLHQRPMTLPSHVNSCSMVASRLSREADRHLKFDALNAGVIDAALQLSAAEIAHHLLAACLEPVS
jgi:hypothetical protein